MNLPVIAPRLDLYDEAEKWSVDELWAKQLERLQWSVGHGYDNVTHYRKAFDDRGIHPDDIKCLANTRLLPLTS
jgi:phenylacetate-CoA ligase